MAVNNKIPGVQWVTTVPMFGSIFHPNGFTTYHIRKAPNCHVYMVVAEHLKAIAPSEVRVLDQNLTLTRAMNLLHKLIQACQTQQEVPDVN